MAEIFQLQAKDAVLRLNHYDAVNAVQNFNWDPVFNEEYKEQLGDSAYTDQSTTPEITASFDATTTGGTVALLKRMIKDIDVNGEFVGYKAGATSDNSGYITHLDLENAVLDLGLAKKANEVFTRTELLTRLYLDSINLTASVDGDASESYNFSGDLGEVFRSPKHDLISVPLVRDASGDVTLDAKVAYDSTTTFEDISKDGTGEWELWAIDQEGVRIMAADVTLATVDPDATLNTGDEYTRLSVTAPNEFREGARIHAILYKNTPGVFPTITNLTAANFLQADNIDILLIDPAVTDLYDLVVEQGTHTMVDNVNNGLTAITFNESDIALRIQSADMSVDMRREALRQIKRTNTGTSIYHRAATYPLQVTSSLTALETDLADWQKLAGYGASDVLDLAGFEGKEWQVVVRKWVGDKVVQADAFLDARVAGRGSSVSVGGRAEVNWSFTGSKILFEGAVLA